MISKIKDEEDMHGIYILRKWVNRTITSTTTRIDAISQTLGGNGTYSDSRKKREEDFIFSVKHILLRHSLPLIIYGRKE